jgi:hypothetical protein
MTRSPSSFSHPLGPARRFGLLPKSPGMLSSSALHNDMLTEFFSTSDICGLLRHLLSRPSGKHTCSVDVMMLTEPQVPKSYRPPTLPLVQVIVSLILLLPTVTDSWRSSAHFRVAVFYPRALKHHSGTSLFPNHSSECLTDAFSSPTSNSTMADDIQVANSQPEDYGPTKAREIINAEPVLKAIIAAATDISRISEPPQDVTKRNIIPHQHFRPRPSNSIGTAKMNPLLSDIDIPSGKVGCSLYVDHLKSYRVLYERLLNEETKTSASLERRDDVHLLLTGLGVLQAMDTRVIHCLIRGDLSKRYRQDSEVQLVINELWRSQNKPFGMDDDTPVQPAVYIQYLVDKDGVGPTAAEYTVLIERMRNYAKQRDHAYALKVDNSTKVGGSPNIQTITSGSRKYLNREADKLPTPERKNHALAFCNALEKRVKNDPEIEKHPLREVGYSNSAHRRLHEHAAHQSSNFLMNLTEVILGLEFGNKYHLDQYVVARLYAPYQAVLAEILITRLAGGEFPVLPEIDED